MSYIVLDVETGGFSPSKHALLSFAAAELSPSLEITREIHIFFIPPAHKVIDERAAAVNGYTPAKWAERGAVPLREGISQLVRWLPPVSKALAFNAKFDRSFVDRNLLESGAASPFSTWVCVMELFKAFDRRQGITRTSYSLASLARTCKHWDDDTAVNAHDALEDVRATVSGYRWIMNSVRSDKQRQHGPAI